MSADIAAQQFSAPDGNGEISQCCGCVEDRRPMDAHARNLWTYIDMRINHLSFCYQRHKSEDATRFAATLEQATPFFAWTVFDFERVGSEATSK